MSQADDARVRALHELERLRACVASLELNIKMRGPGAGEAARVTAEAAIRLVALTAVMDARSFDEGQ